MFQPKNSSQAQKKNQSHERICSNQIISAAVADSSELIIFLLLLQTVVIHRD